MMTKKRAPRTIITEYFTHHNANQPIKATRASTPIRAIMHAMQHLVHNDYPSARVVTISTTAGREVATIGRTINGWIVRT